MIISLPLNKLADWLELGIRISDTARSMLVDALNLNPQNEEDAEFMYAISYEATKRVLKDLLSENPQMDLNMSDELADKVIKLLSKHLDNILSELMQNR